MASFRWPLTAASRTLLRLLQGLRLDVRDQLEVPSEDGRTGVEPELLELLAHRADGVVNPHVVALRPPAPRRGRAYTLGAPASSRILAGGVATSALQPPRQFLGAARNLEEGGSLTILSTALVETGSRMDDVFFEEFKGTGNMELRLRRDLAEKRLYPAIDVAPSGTRRDDLLLAPDERAAVDSLRRALHSLDPQQALELLLDKTRETSSNVEFLRQVQASPVARQRRAAQSLNGAA